MFFSVVWTMKRYMPRVRFAAGAKKLLLLVIAVFMTSPVAVRASQMEQMMIDTQAISMANNVTARPPGHLSMHYNPAGLSQLSEGSWWNQGVTLPHVIRENTFRGNPEFDGWLEQEHWDHRADPIYGERYDSYDKQGDGWGDYRVEDLEETDTADSSVMYVPIYGPLNFAISPRTALSHRELGSRWTFATGMYAPYATGANHGPDDPARFGGKWAYLTHFIYQAPTVSYQMTDNLAVGVGMGAGMTAMGVETDIRSPTDMTALTRELGEATEGMAIPPWTYLYYDEPLYGGGIHPWERVASLEGELRDDFTPNYNLGVLYEPFSWLGLGLVYQSEIKANMHGTFKINYGEDWQKMVHWYGQGPWGTRRTSAMLDMPTNPVSSQRGTLTTELTFPQRIQWGVRVSPLNRLHLMFDLKWAEWSVRDQDKMKMDQDIQLLQVAKLSGHTDGNRTLVSDRFMKDTLSWGVAMEYNLSRKVDIRLGYEFRESANPDQYYDLTSMPDLHNFGVGGSYHFPESGSRIDFALAYWTGHQKLAPEESTNLTSTDYFNDSSNMYAGQHFSQRLDIYVVSVGFMVPFESYVEYQKGNRAKMAKRIGFLNPFKRVMSNGEDDEEDGDDEE